MANEKRVRVNGVGGLIDDNPLTIAATTLTSTGLGPLPLINTTNYAAIVLDPDGLESAPEIVWITSHAANATTATILRSQEGTTAIAHSVDIPWVHAPTIKDYLKSVDDQWAGDTLASGPFDYEFDVDGSPTTLPAGWSWVNQGGASYIEEHGAGRIIGTSQTGDQWRMIVRTAPTAAAWTLTTKTTFAAGPANYSNLGVILRESSSGKLFYFGYAQGTLISISHFSGPTAFVANDLTETGFVGARYWRVKKNSATSYDFLYSYDGVAWRTCLAGNNLTTYCTPDQIGFGADASTTASGTNEVACHWWRTR